MWRVKVTVVPVVIGALGAVTPKIGEWLQQIPGTTSEISVQKSAVLGTAKILRRTLKLPGLWKHYREYLVSLINSHSIDPAPLYSSNELLLACRRYKVEDTHRDGEDTFTYYTRLLEKLMDEVPLGDKVPRKK